MTATRGSKTLIDTAMQLEGMPRNTSTHAAGVVITGAAGQYLCAAVRKRRYRGHPVHHDHH